MRRSVLVPLAAIVAVAVLPNVAAAQDSEATRAKCIADASAAYPGDIQYEHQTARKQAYIDCMLKAGLRP